MHHPTAPELAPESAWYKSSYSSGDTGNCIEIVNLSSQIGIRDSKDTSGPALVVSTAAWSSFVDLVRSGDVDL
ncbi:protein of unknown function [Streptomyces sp. 2112.2]|uniref:DUF397 domain-containing protein n=1 Tax=Streptomyces lydicamycinicus TaxID=1546107 RepID=A0A0P4R706_9ACTN|nr:MULTISPECIES: DUF397 domain-containing protein [Streptomyces]GAO08709.1 hypothetical protein TPA0598_04_03450 [Streptomyces lydicamycinicus]SED63584.1 protein of unknown function [Streptomyces sp. 2112.2]